MILNKKNLKKYLFNRWDVTLDEIMRDFNLKKEDISKLNNLLKELEKDKWIEITYCSTCKQIEIDPGQAQELWTNRINKNLAN